MIAHVEKSQSFKLMPGSQAPELEIQTLNRGLWKLADQSPKNFTMLVFYRGLHCAICREYLTFLESHLHAFKLLGIEAIALSGDSWERAQKVQQDWGIRQLTLGYGQTLTSMKRWGLYVPRGTSEPEPERFGEPGLFLIQPDQIIYYVAINSAPFGRPNLGHLLGSIDTVLQHNSSIRGTELLD